MPDNYYSEVNDHGNVIPIKDLAAVAWADAGKSVKKNLLENKLTSGTISGIVTTVNADGTVTLATGTTTASYYAKIQGGFGADHVPLPKWLEKGKSYIISDDVNNNNYYCGIWFYNSSEQPISNYKNGLFTVPNDAAYYLIAIYVPSGTQFSSAVTFKPMIRLASILDDTYEPYIPDNTELMTWEANAKTGVHNLLENKLTTITNHDVTYTVNANKSISLSGTASDNSSRDLNSYTGAQLKAMGSSLILSGGVSSNIYVCVRLSNWTMIARSNGEDVQFNTSSLEDATSYIVTCGVNNGTNTNGNTVYPMLRLTTDTDSTYQPYAMTNRELTDVVQNILWTKEGNYTGDLDDLTNGLRYVSNTATHNPASNWGFCITMTTGSGDNRIQLFYALFADAIYFRRRDGNGWKTWVQMTLS